MFRKLRQFKFYYRKIENLGIQKDQNLTLFQFFFLGFFVQFNLSYLIQVYDHMLSSTAGVAIIAWVIFQLLVALPITACFLFISAYTRSGVFQIWNCVPLFRGLGYTLTILQAISLIMNHFLLTILFLHHIWIFNNRENMYKYARCDFKGVKSNCFSVDPEDMKNCSKDIFHEHSTVQYLRMDLEINDYRDWSPFKLNTYMCISNFFLWVLLIPVVFIGVRKLYTLFIVIGIFCMFVLLSILSYLHWKSASVHAKSLVPAFQFTKAEIGSRSYGDIYNVEYWAFSFIVTSGIMNIPETIWLGSKMPKKLLPNVAALMLHLGKIGAVFLFVDLVKEIMENFIGENIDVFLKCPARVRGLALLFTLIYQPFLENNNELLLKLYFLAMFSYIFMNSFACGSILVDDISDRLPVLIRYRLVTSITVCFVCNVLSLLLMTSARAAMCRFWTRYEVMMCGTLLTVTVMLVLYFMYSKEVLSLDYMFMYGKEPAAVLSIAWSLITVIALFCIPVVLFWAFFRVTGIDGTIVSLMNIVTVFVFLPVCLSFVFTIAKAVMNPYKHPDLPIPLWGPKTRYLRMLREHFVPERNLCYRHSSVTCQHECLVKVPEFGTESIIQEEKFREMLRLLNIYDVDYPDEGISLLGKSLKSAQVT